MWKRKAGKGKGEEGGGGKEGRGRGERRERKGGKKGGRKGYGFKHVLFHGVAILAKKPVAIVGLQTRKGSMR